tara:strand:- start:3124 stop:3462 length:339 start_codon:yes stop_codon:yes gene_type:complete
MSIPVIPNHAGASGSVGLRLKNDIAESCNLNQTTDISLRGLSIGTPSMSFNSNPNVQTLGFGESITISEGYLANWLVANNLDSSFDQTDPNQHKMSEFPVGRSCQTAGHLPR